MSRTGSIFLRFNMPDDREQEGARDKKKHRKYAAKRKILKIMV